MMKTNNYESKSQDYGYLSWIIQTVVVFFFLDEVVVHSSAFFDKHSCERVKAGSARARRERGDEDDLFKKSSAYIC